MRICSFPINVSAHEAKVPGPPPPYSLRRNAAPGSKPFLTVHFLGALTYQGYLSGKLSLVTPGSLPLDDRT